MNKRQEQKEKTRSLILETALFLFARDGFSQTKTSDIALTANISHGSIFTHFSTKEILIEETINEFSKRITHRTHELVNESCELRDILTAHIQGIEEFEDFYIQLVTESSSLPTSARNTFLMIQSAISHHMSQLAERDMKNGKMKTMPLYLMFNTWIGLIHYYLSNKHLFAPTESVLSKYGQELIDHYLNLILINKEEM